MPNKKHVHRSSIHAYRYSYSSTHLRLRKPGDASSIQHGPPLYRRGRHRAREAAPARWCRASLARDGRRCSARSELTEIPRQQQQAEQNKHRERRRVVPIYCTANKAPDVIDHTRRRPSCACILPLCCVAYSAQKRGMYVTLRPPSSHEANNIKNLFRGATEIVAAAAASSQEKHPKGFGVSCRVVSLSLVLPHQGLSTAWYHTTQSCDTETHMARISVPTKVCAPFCRSTVTATPPFGCPPFASPCSKDRCSVRALSAHELDMNKKTPTKKKRNPRLNLSCVYQLYTSSLEYTHPKYKRNCCRNSYLCWSVSFRSSLGRVATDLPAQPLKNIFYRFCIENRVAFSDRCDGRRNRYTIMIYIRTSALLQCPECLTYL